MLRLEILLKGTVLGAGEARECRSMIEKHDKVNVHVSPGHVFLSYGHEVLDNIQSYDVLSIGESWSDRQKRVKKSYLKLKNLQSPVLDLIFPSCCGNPVLWVVLRNGTIFIWSFMKNSNEGHRWVPTGQFYIVDTSESTQLMLESIVIHKKSNTLLWCESAKEGKQCNIKKMSLPSDVININCNSDIPEISTILQLTPKCKLYSMDDYVIMDFKAPCPPGIIFSWQYQHQINIYKKDCSTRFWQCLGKVNGLYECINFPKIVLKFSRFWFLPTKPVEYIYTCLALRDNTMINVLNSGLVLQFSCNGQMQKLFQIPNFDVESIKGCFIYMKLLCCIFKKKIMVFDLETLENVECIDVYPFVKNTFSHSCCVNYNGVVLEDGNILKLCANNPLALFKSRSKHAAALLNSLNQSFYELVTRLHQIVVNKDFNEDNIARIIDQLSFPSAQNQSVICMIKQMLKSNNICFQVNHKESKNDMLEGSQSSLDLYTNLEELAKQLLEKSA